MTPSAHHHLESLRGLRTACVGPWLQARASVEDVWTTQDSGCRSWLVRWPDGARDFVKVADTPRAQAGLERAWVLHTAVPHPALVAPRQRLELADGLALVFEAVGGEVLYDTRRFTSAQRLADPESPAARLRQVEVERVEALVDTILDAHLDIARAGFTAVDFYDGCILYDFERHAGRLIDFDEYRRGPVRVHGSRLPGSRRFMSPEEWQPGALVDEISNVYMLGRVALELLGDGRPEPATWRSTPSRLTVARRAAHPQRDSRFTCIEALVAAWRECGRGWDDESP